MERAGIGDVSAARANGVAVATVGGLFFVFGFVTWLNGALIPFFKSVYDLTHVQGYLVAFAFYISYTVMALPMASVLARTGYRSGMALGLALMAVGCLIFVAAATATTYALFLLGLFTIGAGLTILQAASNPYIVLLGPPESAAARISIMGIINKSAGLLAPIAFAGIVLRGVGALPGPGLGASEGHALAARLIAPYLAMAVGLLGLAALVRFAHLPQIEPAADAERATAERTSIWQFPQVVLGAITLFGYMGLEVMAGDTIGLFGRSLGVPQTVTPTSFTMAGMVIGYLVGIACIPRWLSQRNALIGSALFGLLCIAGVLLGDPASDRLAAVLWGWSGLPTVPDPVTFVALMGTANALVWPALWPLALAGLGRFTAHASAVLVMAISGGAILPLIFGFIADRTQAMQLGYLLGVPCYAMILYYAVAGHRWRHWRRRGAVSLVPQP